MMLAFNRKKASVTLKDFVPSEFLDNMARSGYEPVIHTFKKGLLDRIDIAPGPEVDHLLWENLSAKMLLGEVFFPEKGVCCYLKVTRQNGESDSIKTATDPSEDEIFSDPGSGKNPQSNELIFEAGEFVPMGDGEGTHLDALTAMVERSGNCTLSWMDVAPDAMKKIKGKSIETPSEKDIELSSILCDVRLESLMGLLKTKGSIVIEEYLNGVSDAEETEYFIDKLFELDFLTEEVVVYDDETQMPIIRAKDRAALTQLSEAGIKSPSGKPIEDLVVKRMAALNADNKYKMNPSWIAGLFLINTLFKLGLSNKDIQVLKADETGDLLFCLFDGVPALFYLTDEIPNESLTVACEDALDQMDEVEVILVSEQEVPDDFIESINVYKAVQNITTISDLNSMTSELAKIFNGIRRKVVQRTLSDINPVTSVNIAGLVMARLGNE